MDYTEMNEENGRLLAYNNEKKKKIRSTLAKRAIKYFINLNAKIMNYQNLSK